VESSNSIIQFLVCRIYRGPTEFIFFFFTFTLKTFFEVVPTYNIFRQDFVFKKHINGLKEVSVFFKACETIECVTTEKIKHLLLVGIVRKINI